MFIRPKYQISSLLWIFLIAIAIGITSCVLTDSVDSGRFIQKRKYNRGFYFKHKVDAESEVSTSTTINDETANSISVGVKDSDIQLCEAEVLEPITVTGFTLDEEKNTGSINGEQQNDVVEETVPAVAIESQHKTEREKEKSGSSSGAHDWMLLTLCAVIGGVALLVYRKFFGVALKVARWSNKNKWKSRGLILLMQGSLTYIGIQIGRELTRDGMMLSNATEIMGSIFFVGGLSSYLFIRKLKNPLQAAFASKVAHCAMAVALLSGSVGIGHRLEAGKTQVTSAGYVISAVQHDETEQAASQAPGRGGLVALYIILGILLVLGLFIVTCAVSCSAGAAAGVLVGLLSVIIIVALIRVMVKDIRRKYPKPDKPAPQPAQQ